MRKRLRLASTPADHGFTQTVVPEPSFRRGVASIVDIRGGLFSVNSKGGRAPTKTTAAALRADRKRVAADFAAVRPQGEARRGVRQLAVDAEAALKL